jgi:hypothetical protein
MSDELSENSKRDMNINESKKIGTPERTFNVRGDSFRSFITGKGSIGSQFLIVSQQPNFVVIEFDDQGHLLRSSTEPLAAARKHGADQTALREEFARKTDDALRRFLRSVGFREQQIAVQGFFLNDLAIGIVDFPRAFSEYLSSPSTYSEDELNLARAEQERWSKEGLYELWLNEDKNLWMTASGEIESS